jgi:hypothetical protein
MFDCSTDIQVNSCWPGEDILHTDKLPEGAVEFIVKAGDGLMIPHLAWHAVQNLEPTIAFGFRINQKYWIEWDALSEEDKDSAQELGYDEVSWNIRIGWYENVVWSSLPAEHRQKLEDNGCTEATWESDDCDVDDDDEDED